MKTTAFEHNVCTRCAGEGYFSCYRGISGGRCFKCGGTGYTYTKRGAVAQASYAEALRKPAADVVVGDVILLQGFSAGSFSVPSSWVTINEVGTDGDQIVLRGENKRGEGMSWNLFPATTVRYAHTADEKAAKLAAAVAFQATLTKTGTPRKRAASSPEVSA